MRNQNNTFIKTCKRESAVGARFSRASLYQAKWLNALACKRLGAAILRGALASYLAGGRANRHLCDNGPFNRPAAHTYMYMHAAMVRAIGCALVRSYTHAHARINHCHAIISNQEPANTRVGSARSFWRTPTCDKPLIFQSQISFLFGQVRALLFNFFSTTWRLCV